MNDLSRLVVAGALALAANGAALAAEVGGVSLDEKATVGAAPLLLNGAGIRTRLFFKVYVASLYLPQKASELPAVLAEAPRRIQLNMLRSLSAGQLTEALNDGLAQANTAAEMAAVKAQADQLLAIMAAFKEVKDTDVITLDFVDGTTRVSWNGELKGTIAGAPFNAALTRIWVGDKAVQADLSKALLGG